VADVRIAKSVPFGIDRFWQTEPDELGVVSTLTLKEGRRSPRQWFQIHFVRHFVRAREYKVMFHLEIIEGLNWVLPVSLEGRDWIDLDERRGEGMVVKRCIQSYQCRDEYAWVYFRLERVELQRNGEDGGISGQSAVGNRSDLPGARLAFLYFDLFGECERSINVPDRT
jgi:hypothetical protein